MFNFKLIYLGVDSPGLLLIFQNISQKRCRIADPGWKNELDGSSKVTPKPTTL